MPPTAETPADVIAALERGVPVPPGAGDRYAGYGILGVQFASGDLLALRRFPVASSGCGYTAVWHRSPGGAWTFHTDATCDQGCTSHFAPALERVAVSPIRLEWDGPWRLAISVDGGREISWRVTLAAPWQIRLVTTLAAAIPERWWTRPRALAAIAAGARTMLGTGPLRLTGRLPSGARYVSNPRRVWLIEASRASIRGVDLGEVTRLSQHVALGDFVIPRRALLASGPLFIEPAVPARVPVPTAAAPSPDGRDRDRARRAG
jgi:hypothetical protein